MKVIKELESLTNQALSSLQGVGDTIVDRATKFLNSPSNGDKEKSRNILSKLGLDHQIEYKEKMDNDLHKKKFSREVYGSHSYKGEDLKKICTKYDLRVLPSKYYNGDIPEELPKIIEEFCLRHGFVKSNGEVDPPNNSFFIMAPTEMFNTIKHVPINMDPILLFKINGNLKRKSGYTVEAREGDEFINVYHWGDDFSWLRKLRYHLSGYTWDSSHSSNFERTVTACVLSLIFMSINLFGHEYLSMISMGLGSIVIVRALILNQDYRDRYLIRLWNSRSV